MSQFHRDSYHRKSEELKPFNDTGTTSCYAGPGAFNVIISVGPVVFMYLRRCSHAAFAHAPRAQDIYECDNRQLASGICVHGLASSSLGHNLFNVPWMEQAQYDNVISVVPPHTEESVQLFAKLRLMRICAHSQPLQESSYCNKAMILQQKPVHVLWG